MELKRDTEELLECVRQATEVIQRLGDAVDEIRAYAVDAEKSMELSDTPADAAYEGGRQRAAEDILEILGKALKGDNNGIK